MVQDQGRYDSTDSELDFDHYSPSFNEDEKWVPPPPTNEPDPVKPRTIFYYIRDAHKRPVVTVCLIHLEAEFARGVAICSPVQRQTRNSKKLTNLEMPRTVRGRGLSFQRAQKAWISKSTTDEIRRGFVRQYLYALATTTDGPSLPSYKSEYMPTLTYMERKLLFGLAVAEEV